MTTTDEHLNNVRDFTSVVPFFAWPSPGFHLRGGEEPPPPSAHVLIDRESQSNNPPRPAISHPLGVSASKLQSWSQVAPQASSRREE